VAFAAPTRVSHSLNPGYDHDEHAPQDGREACRNEVEVSR